MVIGPGSLFTSVPAVVAVPALSAALAETRRPQRVRLQPGPAGPETAGYDVADDVAALSAHGFDIDVVLCHPGALPIGELTVPYVERPVARPDGLAHDPVRLAAALVDLVG